jgi:bidirectional [NiFe] hydrogenase diaphorase subunit
MKIIINGTEIEAASGETILEVARRAGIKIPTLCYSEAFGGQGVCRLCMVEVKEGNRKRLVASCTYPVSSEVEVTTETPAIQEIRRNIVMLLYRRAPNSAYMQQLYLEYGCPGDVLPVDSEERCILCRLCVRACEKVEACAISTVSRGTDKHLGTPYDEASPDCIGCAACAEICPTKAIDVQQTADKRVIWHKEFDLATCTVCGKRFSTPIFIERVQSKLGQLYDQELICPECKRKRTRKNMIAQQLGQVEGE